MITRRRHFIILLAWVIVLLAGTGAHAAEVAVISNLTVPESTLTRLQLLDLYTGDKSFWSDGSPVIVFDLKRKNEIRRAYYRFLGIRSSRVKSIWLKRMLSGDAEPPESLASQKEMLERVTTTPGHWPS